MIRWRRLLAAAIAVPFPAAVAAQDSTPVAAPSPRARAVVTLSLAEALKQARAHSPVYRQTLNDASPARWGVRSAYGNLLPSISASSDIGYTGSGQSNLGGGFTTATSSLLTSGYFLG
ncbi:MAG TPA: hypothetical protein VD930_10980, partial [Gemmatimonadales bacterium]|nr:hypothetical protein [Gemmatimonadales bacterium]